jgi:hypothetical protein
MVTSIAPGSDFTEVGIHLLVLKHLSLLSGSNRTNIVLFFYLTLPLKSLREVWATGCEKRFITRNLVIYTSDVQPFCFRGLHFHTDPGFCGSHNVDFIKNKQVFICCC